MINVYSESMFMLAKEENLLDDFYNTFLDFEELYKDSFIKEFMNNKLVDCFRKEEIIKEYFININEYFKNFLLLLNKNNNLDMLEDISLNFKNLYWMNKGIIKGVVYGVSIGEEDLKNLEILFTKKLDKTVNLEFKEDKSLIAGYKIEVDKKVYDNSYKHKLEVLTKALKKEA